MEAVERRRIIEAAGRRLKRDGIDGSGIVALMGEQREWIAAVAPDCDGGEQIVRSYLSPRHRDSPEEGCPSAALLDEISRCADPTKQACTDGVLAFIDDIAAQLAPHDPQSARVTGLSVYALMIGALQLSRALADRQLADDVLRQGVHNALPVLNIAPEQL